MVFVEGDPTYVPGDSLLGVVAITRLGQSSPSCTGVMIKSDIVLTAAHCVCNGVNGQIYVGSGPPAPTSRFYRIASSYPRGGCGKGQPAGMIPNKDIAVMLLRDAVTDPHVKFLPFAADPVVEGATQFRIVGFGATNLDGTSFPQRKQHGKVFKNQIGKTEIVAGIDDKVDSCNGDSGGPLLVAPDGTAGGDDDLPTLSLAGTISRSVPGALRSCGYGTIFERLEPDTRSWIDQAIVTLRKRAMATPVR